MTDVHSPKVRSRNMSAIRSADTKPEVWLRKMLFARGFRFRKNVKGLPGRPDIVLAKYKAVIQVNGCFWHGHDCALFRVPKTRTEFWLEKISGNKKRDHRNTKALETEGWRVLTVWECALKGHNRMASENLEAQVAEWLCSDHSSMSLSGKK